MVRHLQALGLRPRTLNQEWGPTQYELTFSPVKGLAGGDDNFTYKTYAKEIATQHGLLATFMTKPFIDASGSSSHLHMSLFDGARNIFWDAAQGELTPEFGWAIGGLLRARGRAERLPRADRQLRQALPHEHLRAGERHLGLREPVGRDPRQGRARRRDAHRGSPRLGGLEPVPGTLGHARRDARRHRAARRAAAADPGQRVPPRRVRPAAAHARGLARRIRGRRGAARCVRSCVRPGVPRREAPRDREGARRESRATAATSGTIR